MDFDQPDVTAHEKRAFEPSRLIDYGEAAELSENTNNTGSDGQYGS
jgi:hypothetical protein